MTVYWLLFFYPIVGLFFRSRLPNVTVHVLWFTLMALWILVIGFRLEIGCDWDGYLQLYDNIRLYGNFGDLTVAQNTWANILNWDLGYIAFVWISANLKIGIYGVNTVCGVLIVCGLASFCKRLPSPWLAWLIATPFLLTVVSMGYSRQGVALGFLCWGLSYLLDNRRLLFLVMVLIGGTFHKTVIFMLPLGFLSLMFSRPKLFLTSCVAFALPASWILYSLVPLYLVNPDTGYHSAGAPLRALMNATPAVLFLVLYKRWKALYSNTNSWAWFAWGSIASLFLVVSASTFVDRIGVYLAPIQLYVWSKLPSFLALINVSLARLATGGIILAYGFAHFVWLNFGFHNECWVPYRNLLLEILFGRN